MWSGMDPFEVALWIGALAAAADRASYKAFPPELDKLAVQLLRKFPPRARA